MTSSEPKQRLKGAERANAILDAFESLLEESDVGDISIANVAERADVKRTLVYHFFPTVDAMVDALTDRYCKEIQKRCLSRFSGDARSDFRTTFGGISRVHADFLNENKAAAKLLLGSENPDAPLHIRARPAPKLASTVSEIIEAHTETAHGGDSSRAFPDVVQVLLELTTTLFTAKRRKDGRITDEASEEAANIAAAYFDSSSGIKS